MLLIYGPYGREDHPALSSDGGDQRSERGDEQRTGCGHRNEGDALANICRQRAEQGGHYERERAGLLRRRC